MSGSLRRVKVTINDDLRDDAMSSSTQQSSGGPQLRSGPMITGGALVAAGSLIALAGFVVGGAHLLSATRQWIRGMEMPPSEAARLKWAQARAAAAAAAGTWQDGTGARQGTSA